MKRRDVIELMLAVAGMPKRPSPVRTRGAPGKEHSTRKRKGSVTAPLTDAMILFIQRYMIRFNAQRAYQDSHPNASWATCRTEGSRMRHDPRVAAQINGLRREARKRNKHSANRVMNELSALAFGNLSDVFTGDGTIIPPQDMPREIGAAVKKLKRNEILGGEDPDNPGRRKILGHTVELELHDKVGPLKLLGQHLGLFTEAPREVTLGKDFAAILEAAGQRAIDAAHSSLQPQPAFLDQRVDTLGPAGGPTEPRKPTN